MSYLPTSEPSVYASAVTNDQLWRFVGQELARIRVRAGHVSTHAMYRAGGPATGTLDDIEAGRVGNLDRVAAYCDALNVALPDVIRAVLEQNDSDQVLSADARFVAQMFQEGPNPDLREAILAAAKAQHALQRAGHGSAHARPDDPPRAASGSHGRGRTARTRR